MEIERISIELTNQCDKGCWFCYNHSQPSGQTEWKVDEVVSFVCDCEKNGTRAVSFGGGEPLQFDGVFEILESLDGLLFRSMTTNGLKLDENFDRVIAARPDKVHLSIHFPHVIKEVDRVIRQVTQLDQAGVTSGVNLLVQKSNLEATEAAAIRLQDSGIENDRIVFLPMRSADTPTPQEVFQIAGAKPFQSMTCLSKCGKSERFCSIGWDKTAAWCSYTTSRRRMSSLDHEGLIAALYDLDLAFCGGTDESKAN